MAPRTTQRAPVFFLPPTTRTLLPPSNVPQPDCGTLVRYAAYRDCMASSRTHRQPLAMPLLGLGIWRRGLVAHKDLQSPQTVTVQRAVPIVVHPRLGQAVPGEMGVPVRRASADCSGRLPSAVFSDSPGTLAEYACNGMAGPGPPTGSSNWTYRPSCGANEGGGQSNLFRGLHCCCRTSGQGTSIRRITKRQATGSQFRPGNETCIRFVEIIFQAMASARPDPDSLRSLSLVASARSERTLLRPDRRDAQGYRSRMTAGCKYPQDRVNLHARQASVRASRRQNGLLKRPLCIRSVHLEWTRSVRKMRFGGTVSSMANPPCVVKCRRQDHYPLKLHAITRSYSFSGGYAPVGDVLHGKENSYTRQSH